MNIVKGYHSYHHHSLPDVMMEFKLGRQGGPTLSLAEAQSYVGIINSRVLTASRPDLSTTVPTLQIINYFYRSTFFQGDFSNFTKLQNWISHDFCCLCFDFVFPYWMRRLRRLVLIISGTVRNLVSNKSCDLQCHSGAGVIQLKVNKLTYNGIIDMFIILTDLGRWPGWSLTRHRLYRFYLHIDCLSVYQRSLYHNDYYPNTTYFDQGKSVRLPLDMEMDCVLWRFIIYLWSSVIYGPACLRWILNLSCWGSYLQIEKK